MKFKKNLILVLVILSALTISGAAAYFSVYGLSKLFAGAGVAVIIMASVLEVSKLITAFTLHERKDVLPKLLKVYLGIAVVVLMIITSAGIYGFLSNAYQITATKNTIVEKEVSIIDAKVENLSTRLSDYQNERESIVSDIRELRTGLSSGTQVSYIDKNSGEKITTSSASIRKSLEVQLEDATKRRDLVSKNIEEISAQIDSLKIGILDKQLNNDAAAELGPLIYLSNITGIEMDRVINYFILMIIFVFDPLAICLVISISYLSESKREIKTNSVIKEIITPNTVEENALNQIFQNTVAKSKPEVKKRKYTKRPKKDIEKKNL
jgi:hypothetical protein